MPLRDLAGGFKGLVRINRFPLSLRNVEDLLHERGIDISHETDGRCINTRTENSPLPLRRRERAMQRFRQMQSLQKFAALHGSIHNHFNRERHLYSRQNFKHNHTVALAEWRQLCGG